MKNKYPHIDIGARLKAFREFAGFDTAKDFANVNKFGETQYGNWERGERRIRLDFALQLREAYGLTLDYIYLGRADTLPHNLMVAFRDKPADNATNKSNDSSDT